MNAFIIKHKSVSVHIGHIPLVWVFKVNTYLLGLDSISEVCLGKG